jgi:hypothetical protein
MDVCIHLVDVVEVFVLDTFLVVGFSLIVEQLVHLILLLEKFVSIVAEAAYHLVIYYFNCHQKMFQEIDE